MASAAETSTLTLMAGGDVGPVIEPTEQFSQLIRPTFQQADIRVVQCERTYSELGAYQRWTGGPSGSHVRLHPRMASTFKELGADVASLASNHAMDYGPDPLVDTVDLFRSMGLKTIGAGRNEEEARQPAIVERNGVKVAILGYCSILREGQAATADKPGVAPMRAHTYYEREDFQPGTPAKILTIPYEDDLAALQEDVRRAKRQANAVAIFIHWGVRFLPKVIASYQPQVAHAAIDAGADIIIGHHAHIVKATEVYKGKVCFYSIGNLMTTGSLDPRAGCEWGFYYWRPEPGPTLYPFPTDSKKIMVPKVTFSQKGVERVAFLPAFINNQAQPQALSRQDGRFQEVLDYAEWASDEFPHKFRVEGNEVVVDTSG